MLSDGMRCDVVRRDATRRDGINSYIIIVKRIKKTKYKLANVEISNWTDFQTNIAEDF
jgi:hypothetical protein